MKKAFKEEGFMEAARLGDEVRELKKLMRS